MLRESSIDIEDSGKTDASGEQPASPSTNSWSFRQAWQKGQAQGSAFLKSFQKSPLPAASQPASPEGVGDEQSMAASGNGDGIDATNSSQTFDESLPGWISITVTQQSLAPEDERVTFPWRLNLETNQETKDIIVNSISAESFLSNDNHWIQPGDILSTLNSIDCKKMGGIEDITKTLEQGSGLLTVSVRRPTGNPDLLEATAFNVDQRQPKEQVAESEVVDLEDVTDDDNDEAGGSDFDNDEQPFIGIRMENFDINQSTTESNNTSTKDHLVKITDVSSDGYLGQSVLEAGDEIVSIDGLDMRGLSSQEVECILNSKFWDAPFVTIRVQRKSNRWSIRRAVVAAAGGSLVGVGGVIMATPLHPIGHAMAIGGVAVLGTEFEAPRRVMNSARDSLQKRFGKQEKEGETANDSDKGEANGGEDIRQNSAVAQTSTEKEEVVAQVSESDDTSPCELEKSETSDDNVDGSNEPEATQADENLASSA